MLELFLYVGNGYFNAFCTRVHKVLSDKISYAFSSAYSIKPTPKAQENPSPNLIEYGDGEIEKDSPYSWYTPEADSKHADSSLILNSNLGCHGYPRLNPWLLQLLHLMISLHQKILS